ncbi:hypothetical protein ACFQFC_00620 [Amorphoplanes digitatis]|uniref:Sensor domain-containing protein n=1 Tax=Actinoplanes digitatis TaxID=1868 RepID=A0A7W7HXT9_9ACTN|nr:hypothetical protein [Actinoplanes digitatis]MBB4762678.1 hypothetical protein [Actinoplanes digitatis]GID91822.1 hypothetical protein Adi01nite_12340 [Actinoplanes digitatis]
MRTFTKRSVKLAIGLPAAIAVSAGIGLAATTVDLAASPRAAAAATGAASDAGHRRDHIPKRLKDSLLAVSDLSSGYSALMEPSPSDATAFDDACAMWEGDSEDASQPLGRLTAVKKDDDSAIVMFTNDSLVVVEHIAVIGEDKAQAVVDGFAEAPERCPVITTGEGDDKVRVTQSPLTVPDLGDASAGIKVVYKTSEPPAVQVKMIAVAWQDLSLVLMYLGSDEPGRDEVETIAAAAAEKLRPND